MKVLVVESNAMLRPFVIKMLVEEGFEVVEVETGRQGVFHFKGELPAAVVLATDLDDIDGFQVLEAMRNINENVPIIVISPDESIASAVKMVKAGAYDYIPKSNMTHLGAVARDAIKIGESPEVVHEQMHTEGQSQGAVIHREHDRIPYRQEVKVDDSYVAKAINLSVGGMYIHTGRSHEIGSPCHVIFPLFDRMIRVEGIIRQSDFAVGMGLEFVNLHPKVRSALEVLISNYRAEQKDVDAEKCWILLISDDHSALKMYKSQFMLNGFSILETKELDKAAEYLRARDVSTIIIDVDMDGLDAIQTIRSIKSVEALSKIPVVAFTSSYKSELADGLKMAGAAYFASRMTTPPKKLSEVLKKLQTQKNKS